MMRLQDTEHRTSSMLQAPSDNQIVLEWIDKRTGKKKRQPLWYYQALCEAKTPQQRRTLRSKTFKGMAKAMADQWTNT